MEDVQETVKKRADDDEDETEESVASSSSDPTLVPHSKMFAPKCLVLISKLDCFETFRVRSIATSYKIYNAENDL